MSGNRLDEYEFEDDEFDSVNLSRSKTSDDSEEFDLDAHEAAKAEFYRNGGKNKILPKQNENMLVNREKSARHRTLDNSMRPELTPLYDTFDPQGEIPPSKITAPSKEDFSKLINDNINTVSVVGGRRKEEKGLIFHLSFFPDLDLPEVEFNPKNNKYFHSFEIDIGGTLYSLVAQYIARSNLRVIGKGGDRVFAFGDGAKTSAGYLLKPSAIYLPRPKELQVV